MILDFFCQQGCGAERCELHDSLQKVVMREYKKGEYIAYKGDVVSKLMVLTRGSIYVELILESGLILTSVLRQAPYGIGAVGLFATPNMYRVDVRAAEDCEVGVLSRQAVEDMMVQCRVFMRGFISHAVTRFDVASRHLSILSHKSIKGKLSYYILIQAKQGKFELSKSITELAAYFCVERPSLSRTLSQLVKDGAIRYERGVGEVLNESLLLSYCSE